MFLHGFTGSRYNEHAISLTLRVYRGIVDKVYTEGWGEGKLVTDSKFPNHLYGMNLQQINKIDHKYVSTFIPNDRPSHRLYASLLCVAAIQKCLKFIWGPDPLTEM